MLGFLLKGIGTLELRVKNQTKNAKNIVKYLKITQKFKSNLPNRIIILNKKKLQIKQMIDGGSIISFELKSLKTKTKKKLFHF